MLQDFFLSEITISSLWSLDVEKHFDLALASSRNTQIHFFYQVHKIISVLYSSISEALNFVYIRRVIYNPAFKKIKNKLKMPRNCNFCPILDLVTLNVFVCVSKVITGMKIIKPIRSFSFWKTVFLKSGFVYSVDNLELNQSAFWYS